MSSEEWITIILRDLTSSFGPAGYEREVISSIREHVQPYSDDIITDKLGSLAFVKKGSSDRPRVLLAGHVDEVGFVVSGINEQGFLTFAPLGGWFDQVLLSTRVVVRTQKGDLHGVIAAKPPHLIPLEEASKVITKDNMFIDIGASSADEAKSMGVRVGDPVVPVSEFTLMKNGEVAMGKAFDDRVGAAIAMEVVRRLRNENIHHPNTVYGSATVMEEVGARGAATIAHLVDPDVAIVLEVDIAGDVPGIPQGHAQAKIGKGPCIVTMDATMIPNQALKELAIRVAEENNIPYQLSLVARGGTDAGRIHIHKVGCPSIVIGVPTRHIHSAASIMNLNDVRNAVRLVIELVKKLDSETVAKLTQW
ncbi:MAG: M42 family metallopeptidase [Thermoproteota archaeon]